MATDQRQTTKAVNRGDNTNLKVDDEPTRKAENTAGPDIPPGTESKPVARIDLSVSRQEIRNTIEMRLVLIQSGEFLMGSPDEDKVSGSNEKPQHTVRITHPFYMGVNEVTRGQFRRFVEDAGYQTEAEKAERGAWAGISRRKASSKMLVTLAECRI